MRNQVDTVYLGKKQILCINWIEHYTNYEKFKLPEINAVTNKSPIVNVKKEMFLHVENPECET